jgi:Bacterial Ig domain
VLNLAVEASVINGEISRVEFLKNDVLIGSDETPPYSFSAPAGAQGSHVLRARVVVSDGRTSVSQPVKVTLMGPYQSGVNLNGPALVSNGQSWFSESAALTAGMEMTNTQPSISNETLQFYPHPDPFARSLVSSQVLRLNNTQNPQLAIRYPVPDGDYDVFFSLVEGEVAYSRDVNVSIEGVPVAQGIGDLALGEWVNYGPYRTKVADGMLDLAFIRESKGSPKISNFSIYQAEWFSPIEEAFLSIGTSQGVAVLSWPKRFGPIVETSITLDESADWQDSVHPNEDFGLFHQMVVPTTEPQRFFRLLKD